MKFRYKDIDKLQEKNVYHANINQKEAEVAVLKWALGCWILPGMEGNNNVKGSIHEEDTPIQTMNVLPASLWGHISGSGEWNVCGNDVS